MLRLPGSRFFSLACLAVVWLGVTNGQDLFGDVMPSSYNSNVWKSFQQEMKTLEEAAHRVNNLLTKAQETRPQAVGDQEAKAAEAPETTVLAATGQTGNGVDTKPEAEPKPEHPDSSVPAGGLKQSQKPHINLGSLFNSFGLFNNFPEPWWRGKHVCIQKTEKVEEKKNGEKEVDKHMFIMGTGTFEHCKQTSGKYICTTVTSTPDSTKTVSMTYQCCEGFQRQAGGCEPGDAPNTPPPPPPQPPSTGEYKPARDAGPHNTYDTVDVGKSFEESFSSQIDEGNVELKDPVEVLENVGSKDFASLVKSQNLMRSLVDQNLTFFAPIDEAMKSYHMDFQESNQIREKRVVRAVEERSEMAAAPSPTSSPNTSPQSSDVVKAHITSQLLDVDDFTNEMVLKSLYQESPLRVNIYPGREDAVMTVNCARVHSWDNLAAHARVHTVDRVLEPVTRSVLDILAQPQFSQFRQYLENEELLDMLANTSAITVFAPTNEAWDKLGAGLREKYSRGEACIDRVIRHHILPLTLCAAPAAEGRLTTADIDGELVHLGRDSDNQLMVDDKGRVVQEDVMATNGVVHVLDKVLTPKSAKRLSELLVSSNHTTWLSLLDRAGLMEELDRQENLTLLVPTESALADEDTRSLLEGLATEELRKLLLYHVTERTPACDMRDGASLRTHLGNTLRVTMFNPFGLFSGIEGRAAVQCAPLALTDGKACHATAHEVTRLLLPPNATALQTVASNDQLTVLKQVIEGTEVERELEQMKSEELQDGFTLLAPTDDAFNKLDEDLLSKLLTDKQFADEVIRTHILKEPVCCASIASVPWPFTNSVLTLGGRKVEVNRDRRNRVVFGNSKAEECDIIATDAVLHIVDNVLLPEDSRVKLGNVAFGTPNKKIMLFGI